MNINETVLKIKRLKEGIDWKLLLFLLLFLNVKIAIKIGAVVLIYLLQFNVQFGFKIKNSRLPLFYVIIIVLGGLGALSTKSYEAGSYLFVLAAGMCSWLLCLLAIHQVKLSVERNDTILIHRTIILFFIINAVISICKLTGIVLETGAINPYTYQGQYQKYFISTGDYIKGVTFDTSTTNAILNAFGVIYFLVRKETVMLFICMAVLLLTGSNFINLVLLSTLLFLFIFRSSRDQKSLVVVCMLFAAVFMAKISPQNNRYVLETFMTVFHQAKTPVPASLSEANITTIPDSVPDLDEKRKKIAAHYVDSIYRTNKNIFRRRNLFQGNKGILVTPTGWIEIPKPDINSAQYQSPTGTPPQQAQLLGFIGRYKAALPLSGQPYKPLPLPGKAIGLLQTVNFLKQHPVKMITGDGPGNFSSKLAFRASSLGFSGVYPAKYTYINNDFLTNHLDLYLNFFSKRAGLHSLINSPFSAYDQLLAEYGLPGMLAFCFCYAGFFAKHYRTLTYGLPVLALTLLVLSVDYWFEQLSILVFFELLLFVDIKESSATI